MKTTPVSSPQAPKAANYFSQAIIAESQKIIELSGQIGLDPANMKLVSENVTEQTQQIFQNIEAVLQAAAADLTNIIKVRIYLTDMQDYSEFNTVYADYFASIETPPARVCLAVKALPLGAKVEIECTAVL